MSAYPTELIEIWKDITNYEGWYQVSNWGRVKSLERIVRDFFKGGERVRKFKERVLRPGDSCGYMLVWLHQEGVHKKFAVHRLVLEAFVGPCPEGMEGCHNDGNYKNNHVDNLRWDTHKNNHQDRIGHGTNNFGENNGSAHLTEKDVIEIRRLYATGEYSMKELSERFGLTENSSRRVIRGINWKHVKFLPKSNFGRGHGRKRDIERRKDS